MVYQDELVTAFLDLFPVTPGHTLVIPTQHASLIPEVEPRTVERMFSVGVRIDRALRQGDFKCEAVSLYLADGAAAGQAVHHVHLHVIPRFQGDTCGLRLHTGPTMRASRQLLDEQAGRIRTSLEVES